MRSLPQSCFKHLCFIVILICVLVSASADNFSCRFKNKVRIDLSSLIPGTYYVSVVPANGEQIVKRMVVIK